MTCKGICIRHKLKSPSDQGVMLAVKSAAKYVKFSSSGMVYGVPAVDID